METVSRKYSYNLVTQKEQIRQNKYWNAGNKTVIGAIIIQLAVGSYHGTFGNLLPYFTSFMRQVISCISISQVFKNNYFDNFLIFKGIMTAL
jgi:hypothetical protein